MCVQWCNCVTTSQDVGTGAELIRTMLRTHAHSHTHTHWFTCDEKLHFKVSAMLQRAARGLIFISQHPLKSFFQSFLIPCLLLPCTCHLDICIYSSLCLSRPAWGSQGHLKLASSYPYGCLCTFSPLFYCMYSCVFACASSMFSIWGGYLAMHESMVMNRCWYLLRGT